MDPDPDGPAGVLDHRTVLTAAASRRDARIAPTITSTTPVTATHDDPWAIMYTSGTTGHPKGAIVTHGMAMNITLVTYDKNVAERDAKYDGYSVLVKIQATLHPKKCN